MPRSIDWGFVSVMPQQEHEPVSLPCACAALEWFGGHLNNLSRLLVATHIGWVELAGRHLAKIFVTLLDIDRASIAAGVGSAREHEIT